MSRDRIDGYLKRSDLASRSPRVVPLTGDASDRRYFRVLRARRGRRSSWRCIRTPFDFETLPFVNVARLLAQMPLPDPGARSATPTISACSRSRISAT